MLKKEFKLKILLNHLWNHYQLIKLLKDTRVHGYCELMVIKQIMQSLRKPLLSKIMDIFLLRISFGLVQLLFSIIRNGRISTSVQVSSNHRNSTTQENQNLFSKNNLKNLSKLSLNHLKKNNQKLKKAVQLSNNNRMKKLKNNE